jgi:hypothetical protein
MKKQDVVGKAVAAIIVGGVLFVGWRAGKERVKSAVDEIKRAQELLDRKDYDGVVAYCTDALARHAKDPPEVRWFFHYMRAGAYGAKKEFGSALTDLNEAVRMQGDSASLQLRAKVHEALGNFPQAAADTVRSHALKTAKRDQQRGSGATSEVELTPEQLKAQRTLEYWYQITHPRGKDPGRAPTEPKQLASMFRQCAASIEALPTANVDLDAVRCGLRWKAWMYRTADFIETDSAAAVFGEAFLRGLAGDPFGKAIEVFQQDQAWELELKEAGQSLSDTRALLSARYDIEFPF